jgi:hypothetical protein
MQGTHHVAQKLITVTAFVSITDKRGTELPLMFFIGNTGKPDCEKDFTEIIHISKCKKNIDGIFIVNY